MSSWVMMTTSTRAIRSSRSATRWASSGSVTQGIVSNRSRDIEGQIFLQTDTAINPGNSGGPLFNQRGEVIGVTSRGAHAAMADNLGFAIPITTSSNSSTIEKPSAFDKANPNSGYRYVDPPRRLVAGQPEGLKDRPERLPSCWSKPGGESSRQPRPKEATR